MNDNPNSFCFPRNPGWIAIETDWTFWHSQWKHQERYQTSKGKTEFTWKVLCGLSRGFYSAVFNTKWQSAYCLFSVSRSFLFYHYYNYYKGKFRFKHHNDRRKKTLYIHSHENPLDESNELSTTGFFLTNNTGNQQILEESLVNVIIDLKFKCQCMQIHAMLIFWSYKSLFDTKLMLSTLPHAMFSTLS